MAGALALFAVSCEKDIEPAKPQVNPQEPVLTTGDITTVAAGVLANTSETINLESYRAAGQIPVLGLPTTENLPEGAAVEYKLELSAHEDFSNSVIVDANVGETSETSNNYYVLTEAWNTAHIKIFGRDPKPQTAYFRVPVYVNLEGTDFRYSATNYYALTGTLTESCMDWGFVIEDAYYLMTSGTGLTPAGAKDDEFVQTYSGSPYDQPYFEVKFKVSEDQLTASAGQYKWLVAPKSAVEANNTKGVMGIAPADQQPMLDSIAAGSTFNGNLLTEGYAAGYVTAAGKYLVNIDVWNGTFSIKQIFQPTQLYTPGGSNGWNQLNSAWLMIDGNKNYYGFSPLRDGFKICENPNWNDNNANWGSDPDVPGGLMNGQEAGDIPVETAGLYLINVTFNAETDGLETYTLTQLDANKVGLIGSFAPSNWDSDVFMAPAMDKDGNLTGDWSADVTFEAGQEFKVRFDGDWAHNLGGDLQALTQDGANIKVEESGTYTITLHLLGGYPHLTMEKK